MNTPRSGALVMLAVFALAGIIFSGVSAADFIAHLDRQVHSITCSYVPGLGAADTAGTSGCHAVLMSPYSAVLRSMTWGGIPIALPALALFAFLLFRAIDLLVRRASGDPGETRFLLVATALPVVVSIVYLLISVFRVGAVCKLCVGVYISSVGVFVAAVMAHRQARRAVAGERPTFSAGRWGLYVLEGVVFVALPIMLYLSLKPAYALTMARCGDLIHPEDKYGVMVKLEGSPGGVPAVELLDPLCPACKGFSERLEASGLADRLSLDMVLFPLDKECNWMVSESVHPGSCAVSEAVLCAGVKARDVVEWAFANQDVLREAGVTGQNAVYERIKARFPDLAGCLGKPGVRARLNRSLRWAVSNSLPVATPQLFVRGQKLCEEDTDLGLEYVLPRLLRAQGGR